jgi:hypothetical protein
MVMDYAPIPLPTPRAYVSVSLAGALSSGTHALRPAAGTLPAGSIYVETDTHLTYQVQAGVWVIMSAKNYGTIIIASSAATIDQQAAALASGGTVCDGTADDIDIADALAAASIVYCAGPSFIIATLVTIADGKTLYFDNGCIITPAGDNDCFIVQQGGRLEGHNATIDYETGNRTAPIGAVSIELYTSATARPLNYYVANFHIKGAPNNNNGYGFSIPTKAGNSWIWGGEFRNIKVTGFQYGLFMDLTGAQTWANSNLFDNFIFDDCINSIYITCVAGMGCDNNKFMNFQIQYSAYNVCGLRLLGSINRGIENEFDVVFWDWAGGASSAIDVEGAYNIFRISEIQSLNMIDLTSGAGMGVYNTFVDRARMLTDMPLAPLAYKKGADKTINTGTITVDYFCGYHLLETEGGAASDDLTTLYGSRYMTAATYIFSLKNAAHNVVFKNGAGLRLKGGTDKTLDLITDVICLMYDSTINSWVELWDNI